jgi:hypothetical protein
MFENASRRDAGPRLTFFRQRDLDDFAVIDGSFYTQMSEQWRTEQDKIAREIARHQAADRSYLKEGAQLIELAHGAQRLFAKQEAQEQRRLLNFVLSNSTGKTASSPRHSGNPLI